MGPRCGVWLAVAALLTGVPATAQAQEFTGVFVGQELTLTLSGAGSLTGTVVIDGRGYPVTATASGGALSGHYLYDGERIGFTATLQGDRLVIVSEGETYALTRKPGASDHAPSPATAAPAPPRFDTAAAGASSLSDEGWGIRFMTPEGWEGARGPEGFVLGSKTHKGLIVVFPHEATTLSELGEGAREGFDDDAVRLTLVGTPRPFGTTGLAAEYAGTVDGVPARAFAVGVLSRIGSGAVALAVVEAASYDVAYQRFIESLASSISFHRPPVPDAITSWQRDLAGKRLEYLSYYRSTGFSAGSGSTSQNERIVLCQDGSFSYRDSSRSSIDTGGLAAYSRGDGQGLGRWTVAGDGTAATLVLAFNGGTATYRYRLQMQGGKLYLNGYKYFWSSAGC